jgi:hypothetical protein
MSTDWAAVRHAVPVNPAEFIDVIPLAWQPEAADYAEAFAARNRQRRVGWFTGLMSVLGAAFAVLAIFAKQPAAVALGVVVAIGFPLVVSLMVRASTNALWRRNPALQQPVRMVLDARGISGDAPVVVMNPGAMRIADAGLRYDWGALGKVLETDRVFVVQPAGERNKVFFLLAKRGLADPSLEARLRGLMSAVEVRGQAS